MTNFTTQTVNAYLAVLLITLCGSIATVAIVRDIQKNSYLFYGSPNTFLALDSFNS